MSDTETTKDGTFEGWAIVEVLGHRRLAGHVRQVLMGMHAMLRVDIPEITMAEGAWVSGSGYIEKATKVPAWSTFVSPASLYQLTPCSEEFAREAAQKMSTAPPGFVPKTIPYKPANVLAYEASSNDESAWPTDDAARPNEDTDF